MQATTQTAAFQKERLAVEGRWRRHAAKRAYTIADIVLAHGRARPDAVAFRFLADDGEVASLLTFGELARQTNAIAAGLEDRRGERALLLYPPGPEFVCALLGCLRAGVIAVHAPLVASDDPRVLLSRVEVVGQDCGATLILAPAAVVAQREEFLAHGGPLAALDWEASDILAAEARSAEPRSAAPTTEKTALIQYTSGSTGTARGIPLEHRHLTAQACWLHIGEESTTETVVVGWTPLFHDMGLFLTVMEPLYTGHEAVILSPLAFLKNPVLWPQAIARFRGEVSGGPNFSYELLIRRTTAEQRSGLDLSSWRIAFNSAEPILPATIHRFAETFGPLGFAAGAMCPAYGLAEATCAVAGRPPGTGAGIRRFAPDGLAQGNAIEAPDGHEIVSSGVCYGEQQWAVVHPATAEPLPQGMIGELWLRGPCVARGYLNRSADSAVFNAELANGPTGPWLRTGDMAFLADEELFVVGRLKDILIIMGRNIFPHDVEASVQASHPSLRAGCGVAFTVIGELTEALIIMQEVRAGSEDDPQTVKAAIHEAVQRDHDVEPFAIMLLPPHSIPKTSSGKLQRNTCRQLYLEGRAPLPPSAPAG